MLAYALAFYNFCFFFVVLELSFKCCNVQIDNGIKSGRQEWGQLRYQNIYRPYEAFELVVEWMVATGNKAAELVILTSVFFFNIMLLFLGNVLCL